MQPRSELQRALRWRYCGLAAVIVMFAVLLAACGSSSSSSTTSEASTANGTAAAETETSGGEADLASAEAELAEYTGHPTAFPVDEPLSKPLEPGAKFVNLQCSTPICALLGEVAKGAVEAAGGSYTAINAGVTASSSQVAAESALAMHPDVVIISAVQPQTFGNTLKELSAAGTKVVSISVAGETKPYGITFNFGGTPSMEANGKLLADWAVVKQEGKPSEIAFYGVPELSLSPIVEKAFETRVAELCPECSVRSTPIDITTLGKTAPQTVVSDLQAHPDTDVAVFLSAEATEGLPSAMKAAGIELPIIGLGPEPGSLQEIKEGEITAGLAIDLPVSIWTAVDAGIRLTNGEPLTKLEEEGSSPEQLLEQKDITFDPAKGWTGYPNFPVLFAKLWHPTS